MRINIANDTDTSDGRESTRQTLMGVGYFLFLIISWYAIKLLQYFCINFMLNDSEAAAKWLSSDAFLPWNILLWGMFWIWGINRVLIIQGPNHVRVTMDSISPEELASGGTEYIVYGPGVALRSFTETEGFETDIEREEVHHSADFTCSIKKISLQMRLMCIWTPLPRRLSVYFQNGRTDAERKVILESGIMTLAKEMAEVTASKMKTAEHARAGQRRIADVIEAKIIPLAEEYGFLIKKFAFANCDYPPEVQALLNQGIVATTLTEIVEKLVAQKVPADKAAELAPIYAGIKGITIDRQVWQVEADANISEAIKAAGPALVALVAAWKIANKKPTAKPAKTTT